MNKQTHLYTNIRKESLSNTFNKKNYPGVSFNEIKVNKNNFDCPNFNNNNYPITDRKNDE
jgi:hypothetical protein